MSRCGFTRLMPPFRRGVRSVAKVPHRRHRVLWLPPWAFACQWRFPINSGRPAPRSCRTVPPRLASGPRKRSTPGPTAEPKPGAGMPARNPRGFFIPGGVTEWRRPPRIVLSPPPAAARNAPHSRAHKGSAPEWVCFVISWGATAIARRKMPGTPDDRQNRVTYIRLFRNSSRLRISPAPPPLRSAR